MSEGKKVKKSVCFRIPLDLDDYVSIASQHVHMSKSRIVEIALKVWLEQLSLGHMFLDPDDWRGVEPFNKKT